jgi:hypothetical protein
MNKPRAKTNLTKPFSSILRNSLVVAMGIGFGTTFWLASLPLALGAAITPAEMIQAHLPHSMSLGSAPKAQVLEAVCQAISQDRKDAPKIVRAAADARKELTSDILKTAVRCLKMDQEHPDCALARSTLQELIAADPNNAAGLTEIFIGITPGCADTPEEGPGGPSNINEAPGSFGGGGGADSSSRCEVCHNNHNIAIPCSKVAKFLKNHPGDTAGACQATPHTNR